MYTWLTLTTRRALQLLYGPNPCQACYKALADRHALPLERTLIDASVSRTRGSAAVTHMRAMEACYGKVSRSEPTAASAALRTLTYKDGRVAVYSVLLSYTVLKSEQQILGPRWGIRGLSTTCSGTRLCLSEYNLLYLVEVPLLFDVCIDTTQQPRAHSDKVITISASYDVQ